MEELIQNVGMNKEGEINFTEFLVAAMNREKLVNSKQIEKAFKMFDDDGNGYIDLEELKMAMSGVKLSDDEWKNIIKKYDVDGDGVVSLLSQLLDLVDFCGRIQGTSDGHRLKRPEPWTKSSPCITF